MDRLAAHWIAATRPPLSSFPTGGSRLVAASVPQPDTLITGIEPLIDRMIQSTMDVSGVAGRQPAVAAERAGPFDVQECCRRSGRR
jgi:hypothetical protein